MTSKGLLLTVLLFVSIGIMIGVAVYAFRPKNKKMFEKAASAPLEDDENE